jgi:hypothetical protein
VVEEPVSDAIVGAMVMWKAFMDGMCMLLGLGPPDMLSGSTLGDMEGRRKR